MSANAKLKAPFPYFGGKSAVAGIVWERFGNVANYVEPFFGSGAVLLARPGVPRVETVNDMDSMLCNFWRATKHDPDAVAKYADWPVNENDLHARHARLIERKQEIAALMRDPDAFDAKAAGWWVWGISLWIGDAWCERNHAKLPRLADSAVGITKRPAIANNGRGVHAASFDPHLVLFALSNRLRLVRVCCGDWKRVCTPAVTTVVHPDTAVFFDPPYGSADRDKVYVHDSYDIAGEVMAWCRENGESIKVAVCGYDGEYNALEDAGWDVFFWKAQGGFGNQRKSGVNDNARKERIWFSPRCHNGKRLF